MSTLPFDGYLAVPIARQMIATREPFRIAEPRVLRRTIGAAVNRAFDTIEHALAVSTLEHAFCAENPAECAGFA